MPLTFAKNYILLPVPDAHNKSKKFYSVLKIQCDSTETETSDKVPSGQLGGSRTLLRSFNIHLRCSRIGLGDS